MGSPLAGPVAAELHAVGTSQVRTHEQNPVTIQNLKAAIREEMGRVTVAMVNRTSQHLQRVRLPLILERQGAHLEHMLEGADDAREQRRSVRLFCHKVIFQMWCKLPVYCEYNGCC